MPLVKLMLARLWVQRFNLPENDPGVADDLTRGFRKSRGDDCNERVNCQGEQGCLESQETCEEIRIEIRLNKTANLEDSSAW